MKALSRAAALAGLALAAALAAAPRPALALDESKATTTLSGLKIIDTKVGTGASPKPGQTCVMHYTGWLYENGKPRARNSIVRSIAASRSSSRSARARSSPAGTKASPP